MKNFKLILSLVITVLLISCSNMKNKDKGNGSDSEKPKTYTSFAEAANAAKNDMMAAMDQNVNFGVDKEKLRNAVAGQPLKKLRVKMDQLISSDSSITLEKMSVNEGVEAIPFINNNEVVAVIGLTNNKDQYSISGLGDLMLSKEMNELYNVSPEAKKMQVVYEVDNLSAMIYEVPGPNGNVYYSSYNGHNLREPVKYSDLMLLLKKDALEFNKRLGDKLKKGNLVK